MSAANGLYDSVHHSVATDPWARLLGVLFFLLLTLAPESGSSQSTTDGPNLGPFYTNTISMRLARIPAGESRLRFRSAATALSERYETVPNRFVSGIHFLACRSGPNSC